MLPTREAELLCLLNLARRRPADEARARELSTGPLDWPAFFGLATHNSALLLTTKRLHELDLRPPGFDAWEAKQASILEAAQSRSRWAVKFLGEAAHRGIEVIVLKGGVLGAAIYGDPDYKKMNDIDVLVRKADARAFAEGLRGLGFASVGNLLGREEFPEDSHHCPPFVSPDLKCMVGIHWGLTSPYSRWKPDHDEIWKHRAPVEIAGAPAFRMSWEENLLHLCTHLPFFKIGVRELADVYNLCLFSDPKVDWARLDELVRRWRAEDAAFRVISLAHALAPFDPPAELVRRWRGGAARFTIRDTEERLGLGFALIATRSVHIGKIEKAFSIFRLSECYSERVLAWAMTWKLTFWPKPSELPQLIPHGSYFRRRILAGAYCWRAMAKDYGQLALVAITLINVGIVLRDTLLRPFRKSGESIRKHPAAKLLEALE